MRAAARPGGGSTTSRASRPSGRTRSSSRWSAARTRRDWTRDEGWTRDIDYLHDELRRTNPDYHDAPLPAEVTRRYEALRAAVPRLSDEEVYVGMGRMLAPLRQGHVALFPHPEDRELPLQLYAFPEGIFVVGGRGEHAALAGSRVLAVGGVPAEEALRRVSETQSADGDGRLASRTKRSDPDAALDRSCVANIVLHGEQADGRDTRAPGRRRSACGTARRL